MNDDTIKQLANALDSMTSASFMNEPDQHKAAAKVCREIMKAAKIGVEALDDSQVYLVGSGVVSGYHHAEWARTDREAASP